MFDNHLALTRAWLEPELLRFIMQTLVVTVFVGLSLTFGINCLG